MRNFVYNTLQLLHPISNKILKHQLRVLAYHDIIDPANFEAQIIWLKSNYNIIDIATLKDHLFRNKKLPQKPLLITLDDGDKTVYTKGLPIFKKHKVPSCLFIITELIGTKKDFWWNTIAENEKKKGLSQSEIMKVINANKSMPNKERTQFLKSYPTTYQEQLTIDEVKELKANKIHIANHSHTHPMFDKLEEEELVEELEQVEFHFKKMNVGDYGVFAYPNGNFSKRTEQILKEKGIKLAFLFNHKVNVKNINPLRISRIAVDSHNPLPEFKSKVSGLHPLIMDFKKKALGGKN